MTDPNLERKLRDHYFSMYTGSTGRAPARVADALDRAPERGRRGLGRFASARGFLAAGAALAVVAALTVALLPMWHG